MKTLTQFWQTLESVPGPAAVSTEWQRRLGTEYRSVKAEFLRPRADLAESYPCPDPRNPGASHKVVHHGQDDIVGVCAHGCPVARLAREDIVIWELNRHALTRALTGVLGLRDEESKVDGLPKTVQLGTYAPYAGFRFPAFLTIRLGPDEFRQTVAGLLASTEGPFILLAPTRNQCTPASENMLNQRGARFLALSETMAIDDDGRLALARDLTVDGLLAGFRQAHLPQPEDESGMVFFRTPAEARWEDVRIVFRDSHTVSVKVGDLSRICHYSDMGMADQRNANPTKQWQLLESFAVGQGILNWDHPDASRKNKKRCQTLAGNLRAFFRIEGYPLVPLGNGWRARFTISFGE